MNTEQFVATHGITAFVQPASTNPHMEGSDNMDNYRVTLKHGKRRLTVYFSKGVGHHGKEPSAEEVIDCMASDAAGIENASGFDDWCSEYGFDADSRKAERVFKACQRQARQLNQLLGDDLFGSLLWHTDRD